MSAEFPGDALLQWASNQRQDLPWRQTRDPWAVLVAELMLQQTQVSRVAPRWHQFLERFPTIADCAQQSVGAVIEEWAGLGYNRRAVNLHRCAQVVCAEHDGKLPTDIDALMLLPGIGPYTARAIAAFAYEQDVAVVDTNVGRVLARFFARKFSARGAQVQADEIVPHGKGWAWNQGMLDVGAVCCVKRNPRCEICPLQTQCEWNRQGRPSPDPAEGSAGVSKKQSAFHGSFRQGRARMLDELRKGITLLPQDLVTACGWQEQPDGVEQAQRAADSLVKDGLATTTAQGHYVLAN
ncbi:MAG: A/G-specific adenine glycosylase [Actinomycetota bacterium]